MDRFDTERFIDEVEKRPAIWNTQCPDYSNKSAKNRAWQELVAIFTDKEESMEKRALLGTTLRKKWKNIRDAYNKEYKKICNAPPGSGTRGAPQYMYFARLAFLQRSIENRRAQAEQLFETKRESNEEENKNFVEIRSVNRRKKRPRRSLDDHVHRGETMTNEDEDKLFCVSLYKELKRVPAYKRLSTKIELLQVIQRGQNIPPPTLVIPANNLPDPIYWRNSQYTAQGIFPIPTSPAPPHVSVKAPPPSMSDDEIVSPVGFWDNESE